MEKKKKKWKNVKKCDKANACRISGNQWIKCIFRWGFQKLLEVSVRWWILRTIIPDGRLNKNLTFFTFFLTRWSVKNPCCCGYCRYFLYYHYQFTSVFCLPLFAQTEKNLKHWPSLSLSLSLASSLCFVWKFSYFDHLLILVYMYIMVPVIWYLLISSLARTSW